VRARARHMLSNRMSGQMFRDELDIIFLRKEFMLRYIVTHIATLFYPCIGDTKESGDCDLVDRANFSNSFP
jgi:hypothetical protein